MRALGWALLYLGLAGLAAFIAIGIVGGVLYMMVEAQP